MAIIQPTRSFDGADLSASNYPRLIRSGVRVVSFRKDENRGGVYLVMLPPYRTDAQGRGVSWRLLEVREKFGLEGMDLFAVIPNCPVGYLVAQARQKFPEYVAVEEAVPGSKFGKKYPPTGKLSRKVLFNVAYASNLGLGCHVLSLPQYGGGSEIESWYARKQPDGSPNRLLNDPAAAIPIFVELKKGEGIMGNPWVVRIEPGSSIPLPAQLCDADYLYNLDEVVEYPTAESLIDRMRTFVPPHIFAACMDNYVLPDGSVFHPPAPSYTSAPAYAPAPVQHPAGRMLPPGGAQVQPPWGSPSPAPVPGMTMPVQAAPVMNIPRATIPSARPVADDVPFDYPVPQQPAAQASNPVPAQPPAPPLPAGTPAPAFTAEQALQFLKQGRS